jgi:hypothetical protein
MKITTQAAQAQQKNAGGTVRENGLPFHPSYSDFNSYLSSSRRGTENDEHLPRQARDKRMSRLGTNGRDILCRVRFLPA